MNSAQSLVVVGLQWGDEGKGKIVDVLSENYDIVVRFQGGSNAGHTVIVGDKTYKFRILPTGAIRGKKVVIGNGVVVDPLVLLEELDFLRREAVTIDLLISDRAHIITPYQIQIDTLGEIAKGNRKIGTTRRGIGPTYSDKVSRIGVRLCDFSLESSEQWSLLEASARVQIEKTHGATIEDPAGSSFETFSSQVRSLLPYIGDSGELLETEMRNGQRVLFEGAQGALLDVDHGTYPFVTSSNCVSAAAATGTGISFSRLESVLGVCKAYMTRVGTGPFPTELDDDVGQLMRDRGKEYGTVTGRPRRCGWLDLVALRYTVRLNGCEHLAVTKADVLTGINPLKVCVAYDIDGIKTKNFPASAEVLSRAIPVYQEFEGWFEEIESTSNSKTNAALPRQFQHYLSFIEKSTSAKISMISTGPRREDTIML